MAEIHDVTLTPGKDDLVAAWIGEQRWYAAKGARPRLHRVDSWRLDDPAGEVGIETLVYRDEAGPSPVLYQVPLTYRGAPLAGAEHALVGELEHPVLGHRWVYDAPHDEVYVSQLLALLRGRVAAQHGSRSWTEQPQVVGAPHPAWPREPSVGSTQVLRGEQSNTSIIVQPDAEHAGAPAVIVKVFRTLAAGENPDVTLQGALAASGSPVVPASVGHVAGAWQGADGGSEHGQLAFAQEFLPGTTDAWRVVLQELAAGRSFAEAARALGAATAQIHAGLARVMPTTPADAAQVEHLVDAMRRRAAVAAGEVPAIARHGAAVARVLDAAAAADWPALQRIHGDYHLGQVLDVPGRGWVAIDFEGEPLRPLAERNLPDSPLRDVAGMLRSFDYAGASVTPPAGTDAGAWVAEAQQAFLDGYAQVGDDPRAHPELLAAHVLDKALYEVVYESRNRPTWLHIPTTAIDRTLQEAAP